ncbi:hypothetical protein JD844_003913 [Phrynosoma platyrhinos]|uniref:TSC22 domain family protein 3 n=1 Tax=Phrynosoma platyrhinos TaxID=52577 RepID=A0ABQ7TLM2_PHRPL|nr:hypothetical protein JD844_003913 [Phrynosoma platyrhinos]
MLLLLLLLLAFSGWGRDGEQHDKRGGKWSRLQSPGPNGEAIVTATRHSWRPHGAWLAGLVRKESQNVENGILELSQLQEQVQVQRQAGGGLSDLCTRRKVYTTLKRGRENSQGGLEGRKQTINCQKSGADNTAFLDASVLGIAAQPLMQDQWPVSSPIDTAHPPMDLVKNHLMYAVREEVEVLKEQIKELAEKNSQLERENSLLKTLASPEQLQKFQSCLPLEGPLPPTPTPTPPPSSSSPSSGASSSPAALATAEKQSPSGAAAAAAASVPAQHQAGSAV